MQTLIPLKQKNLKTLKEILEDSSIMLNKMYEIPLEPGKKAIITITKKKQIKDENELSLEKMNAKSLFFEDESADEFSTSAKKYLKRVKFKN